MVAGVSNTLFGAEKRQGKEKKVEWKVVHLGPWFDMKTPFGCCEKTETEKKVEQKMALLLIFLTKFFSNSILG